MKFFLFILLGFSNVSVAQSWQAELMAGVCSYNGDLTQHRISLQQLKPGVNLNLKYNSGDYLNFRIGIGYGKIGADDKNNTSPGLKSRNLNFKSDIIELNLIMEVTLFDPDTYTSYPYVFGGVGVFHFNPYTFDSAHKKTFLQPLSTEGEGLSEYPSRKKYSLNQFCLPFGIGWKMPLNAKWDISYEFGYRITFTDYLDDVSKTYINPSTLAFEKGPEAVQLAYRGKPTNNITGRQRGNPSIKDSYYFAGIKISTNLRNLFNRSDHRYGY